MVKYDVLCVGSATLDHFLRIKTKFSQIKPGDKILVDHQETHSGGGGTNVAAALSKLGIKVKLLTKLGSDLAASAILNELREYKVNVINLPRSRKPTDSSTILFSFQDQDRIIFVHKGASRELSITDVKTSSLAANWIYLSGISGKSWRAGKFIVNYAREQQIKLLFNPSLDLAQLGAVKLRPILCTTKLLILNKEEAQALAASNSDSPSLLTKLERVGPEIVIITDGAKRLYAADSAKIYSLQPPKIRVVQTAGAGDAFTSGVLAGIIKGYSLEGSLQLGQVNALSVIQDIGTKNKLLNEKQAKRLMTKYKIVVNSKLR